MSLEPLGNLIKTQMKGRAGMALSVFATQVVEISEKELSNFSPRLAEGVRIVSFKDGVLTVCSRSGAAAAELKLQEQRFLGLLSERFGKRIVHRLRYTV